MKTLLMMVAALVVAGCNEAAAGSGGYTPTEQACLKELGDHLVIANARLNGKTADELKAAARHPAEQLPQVMTLIDEAYAAHDVREWFQTRYWFPCVGQTSFAPAAEFDRRCEAQIIADFRSTLTKEQWHEVIDTALAQGRIESAHAAQLRQHIEGVYASSDYVRQVCQRGQRVDYVPAQDRAARCHADAAVAQKAAEIAIAEPQWPIQTFAFEGQGERRLMEWVEIADWAVAMVRASAAPDAHAIGKLRYRMCVDRWQDARAGGFLPVKSEGMVKPEIMRRHMCKHAYQDAYTIAYNRASGVTEQAMLDYPANPETSAGYREEVRAWIRDAYAYDGPPRLWLDRWTERCLRGEFLRDVM